jgi:hypothetical protein
MYRSLAVVFILCASSLPAFSDGYTVQALAEPPPAGVSAPVRETLAPSGHRVLDPDGKPFLDLWLRKAVAPAEAADEIGVKLGALGTGTLVGAARAHGGGTDFRGNRIKPGAYTLRYAIQPQDGDHQGVSETRDYLILAPAEADGSPDAMGYEPLVKLSTKVTGKKHPAILYLAGGGAGETLPAAVHDEANDRWLLECALPAGPDAPPHTLRICIVGRAAE